MRYQIVFFTFLVFICFRENRVFADTLEASAPAFHHAMGPADCTDMEVWDDFMGMCSPYPMSGMPMRMLMFHGNGFLTQTFTEGRRGMNALSAPNMFMLDAGTSVGDRQYVAIDWMGTFERWTYPNSGYPELLQIGEENADHQPYLDAQHPHSSPIMGLMVSDTIALSHAKDLVKLWFAPRGQSSDGPIAFMHRPTGMVNPDAPLGHHIGQDVGHITSTVVGTQLRLGSTSLEVSGFNGSEPEPSKVDLPIGPVNSYSSRLTEYWTEHFFSMISAAYVKSPDSHDPDLDHLWRYSVSFYNDHTLQDGWMFHNAFIWGLINGYDQTSALNSFAEEFYFHKLKNSIWSRIEVLQRTPAELQIAVPGPASAANDGRWVTALTLGYTYKIGAWENAEMGLGASLTKDLLPSEYQAVYSGDPLTAKVFLQATGMKMWDL
jgi:hypothetical protein